MHYSVYLAFVLLIMNTQTIFDFNKDSTLRYWNVVDDTVMGGRSAGNFKVNDDGHGEFYGNVSLENNGGFSSIRHSFSPVSTNEESALIIRLKGDGKTYQVRVKDNRRNYYSYITYVKTNTDWEEIELPLNTFYPSFRGRKLNGPNFDQNQIEELAILIGNKENESFKLLIDKIELH